MIHAVLWDFGGVLTSSPFAAFNRFEKERGIPLNFIRQINATNPESNAWARFESNQLTLAEFDVAFESEAKAAGHSIPGRQVIQLLSGDIRPRMVEVLKICKQHYKVACITNNVKAGSGPGMARDEEKVAQVQEVMSLFDLIVESSIEGIRKPNPEIYKLACARLAVSCNETVFLDDLGVNLSPARALGMATVKVVSEDQAIKELADILGIHLC